MQIDGNVCDWVYVCLCYTLCVKCGSTCLWIKIYQQTTDEIWMELVQEMSNKMLLHQSRHPFSWLYTLPFKLSAIPSPHQTQIIFSSFCFIIKFRSISLIFPICIFFAEWIKNFFFRQLSFVLWNFIAFLILFEWKFYQNQFTC